MDVWLWKEPQYSFVGTDCTLHQRHLVTREGSTYWGLGNVPLLLPAALSPAPFDYEQCSCDGDGKRAPFSPPCIYHSLSVTLQLCVLTPSIWLPCVLLWPTECGRNDSTPVQA